MHLLTKFYHHLLFFHSTHPSWPLLPDLMAPWMKTYYSSSRKSAHIRNMGEETHYSNNSLKGKCLPAHLPRSTVVSRRDGDQEGQLIVRVFVMGNWRGEKKTTKMDRKGSQRSISFVHSSQHPFLPPKPSVTSPGLLMFFSDWYSFLRYTNATENRMVVFPLYTILTILSLVPLLIHVHNWPHR